MTTRRIAESFNPTFTGFDPEELTLYIATLAVEHGLHLYEVPSLEGSDTFGFVLSKQTLDTRELQQIEADFGARNSTRCTAGTLRASVPQPKSACVLQQTLRREATRG